MSTPRGALRPGPVSGALVRGVGPRGGGGAGRAERGKWYMSLLLHGSLIVACVIAIFPVFWILISSFKPQHEIISSSLTLNDPAGPLADLELHRTSSRTTTTIFLTWFWNSIVIAILTTIVGVFLAATAGVRVLALPLPRLPAAR